MESGLASSRILFGIERGPRANGLTALLECALELGERGFVVSRLVREPGSDQRLGSAVPLKGVLRGSHLVCESSCCVARAGDFGPPGAKHPEYPFWRLRSDGTWLVECPKGTDLAALKNSSHDVPASRLRDERAAGRLLPEIESALATRPSLVNEVVARLLERSFPPTLHEDILDAVGMPYRAETDRRRPRDADFRELILRIYERRCAMCGFDGRLGRIDFGIEAAHVQWHAFDGPDIEENGLCLCSLHHKVLDAGALGVGEDGRVLVSEHLCGGSRVQDWLIDLRGRWLSTPTQGHAGPQPAFIKWHREQVFREPPRAT